jgi:uncharacterized protein (DUF488 family)
MNRSPGAIFTIGHSNHPIATFTSLLLQHAVERVVDIRSIPWSRRNRQFDQPALAAALDVAGIAYTHMETLGGRRKPADAGGGPFAAYAAYAKTDAFRVALTELEALARTAPAAILCAEGDWRRCHRQIVAEHLARDGFTVTHILPAALAAAVERSPGLPGL